jgi:copper(I)-binding protein
VNLFKTAASAITGPAVLSVVAAVTLTGCGSGQISQTATQESAVNGSSANIGEIALRDVRIQADQTGDAVQPGKTVDLLLVATNQSANSPDRLLSVSSDIGSVAVHGDTAVPPLGSLLMGAPYQQDASALSSVKAANLVTATVTLNKPITSGPLYNFTFTFERNGQATLGVPVTARAAAPRTPQAAPAGSEP